MSGNHRFNGSAGLVFGALAGLAGTAAMIAMRTYDEHYAPATIPRMRQDPGEFIVKKSEKAVGLEGKVPNGAEKAAQMATRLAYGTLAGTLYAAIRGRRRGGSDLLDGAIIGVGLYAAGYAGWLPLLKFSSPAWKQPLPQIAGEALRHVVYGVSTAAVYGVMNALR